MSIPRITTYSLIGRDDEVRRIDRLLGSLHAGKPAVLVLEGPRGSGRTRLLDETARLARRRDFTVVTEPVWTRLTGVRKGPLLFLADDPPRIDPRAWSVVESFAERAPVLVAITGLIPLPAADIHRIRVTPLAPAAQAELVARTVGARPDPLLMDLCRVAAGRPGPLRELLAGLSEEGLLRIEAGWATVRTARLPRPIAAALRAESPRRPIRRITDPAAPRGPIDWTLLSAREREIAELAGQALTNRQIASRTAISTHTVNFHLRQIFRKLEIGSRVELAALIPRQPVAAADGPEAETCPW